MVQQSVSLYYKDGSSDKEYHIQLVKGGSGFVVNFQYGRRGGTLQKGTKTNAPVDLAGAQKIYDKLENEKRAKGYEGESGGSSAKVVSATVVTESRKTGILVQLLNEIQEDEVEKYLTDDAYLAQEKHDGERRPVEKNGESVIGANKKGLSIVLEDSIAESIKEDGIYDGEAVSTMLYVFDLLSMNGKCIRHLSVEDRVAILATVKFGKHVEVSETAFTTKEKRALFARMKKENREGIVFKLKSAKYVPGRPSTGGGAHLKHKFRKTASFIVANHTKGKSSVGLVLLDGTKEVPVGKCTIAGAPMPAVGSVIEVKYLYAYKGGAIFQPSYKGPRNDVDRDECLMSQLVFKRDNDDEDDT